MYIRVSGSNKGEQFSISWELHPFIGGGVDMNPAASPCPRSKRKGLGEGIGLFKDWNETFFDGVHNPRCEGTGKKQKHFWSYRSNNK